MTTERLSLEAQPREAGPKGPSRRLRVSGMLPAVVYGSGSANRAVALNPKAFDAVLRTEYGFNNVFELTIAGESGSRLCMVKERQIDSVKRVLTHVDLLVVDPEREVSIRVPIKAEGRSAGERAGGRLQVVARDVLLRCKIKDIPAAVTHDVSELNLGESLYINQITPPTGCTFVYRNRFPVLMIARKRGAGGEGDDK